MTTTDPHTTPLNGKPFDFFDTAKTMAEWQRVLHGDSPAVEMRVPKCSHAKFRKPHTRRGYYEPAKFEDMCKQALVLNREMPVNVYMTLNRVNADLLSRCCNREDVGEDTASDAHIDRRRWILVDLDPKRIAGVSSTDDEKAAAFALMLLVRRFLDAAGWPTPIVADSGNGWHLLYRIDLPADDGGLVERCLKALAKRFDTDAVTVDTTVFNPSRIVKLYGTISKKGDNTPQRPWRRSKIVSIPASIEIVPLDLLESLAACAPTQARQPASLVAAHVGAFGVADAKLLTRIEQYMARVPPAVSGQHGHDATLKAANILVWRFALTKAEALPILQEWNSRCEPPWDDTDLERKIDEALKRPHGEYGELRRENKKPARARKAKPGATKTESTEAKAADWCDLSDLGNARLFVTLHGNEVRFCHPWAKWLAWDGTRWAVDESGAVVRLAKDVADHRWHEALEAIGDEDAMKFAVKSASAERITAMLKLAQSEPGVPVMPHELDRDPWLLNCANGTVDLRTGKLRPAERSDLMTKLCPTAFDPEAGCYHFDRFLEAIFDGQQPLVDFARRYFGYSITGDVREQILLILWGIGSNGKSTLLNALMDTLGSDYTLKAVADLLLQKRNETHPTERADLFGRRFVVCVETADGRALNEAFVKEATGGDPIRARRLYEDFWEFRPTHKPALCTNHKPRVRGTDHAIWRRLVLLPFAVKFWNPDKGESGPPELQQNKSLPQMLASEAEGILAWLVRGCLEWQQQGLCVPPEVQLATSEYQTEQDTIGAFIAETCIVSSACRVRAGQLYDAYKQYIEAAGEHPIGQRKFGEAMTAKGFERLQSAGWWYIGIGVAANVSDRSDG